MKETIRYAVGCDGTVDKLREIERSYGRAEGEAERARLRALLRKARRYVDDNGGPIARKLLVEIDAALT